MNSIQRLLDHLRRDYPAAKADLTPPLREGGIWSLDIDMADKHLAIQWSSTTGFGISTVSNENFGEGPDEVFERLDRARGRVDQLLTTSERTSPKLTVLLSRLREERGITQQELARRLGVRQATVSGIEHRDDVQLSTLRRVVEALGGALQVFAVFANACYRVNVSSSEPFQAPALMANELVRASVGAFDYQTTFRYLYEAGTLESASQTALVIRENHSVIQMVS